MTKKRKNLVVMCIKIEKEGCLVNFYRSFLLISEEPNLHIKHKSHEITSLHVTQLMNCMTMKFNSIHLWKELLGMI